MRFSPRLFALVLCLLAPGLAASPAPAVAAGARPGRVLFRQILPNCVSPVIVRASLDMGLAILTAAALGFLGLGAQEPTFATVFAFNVLGDGLRDALDPRMRDA